MFSLLSARSIQAGLADDVELNPVSQNLARHFGSDGTDQPLNGGVKKLLHRPATDTDQMVVMFHPGETVLG